VVEVLDGDADEGPDSARRRPVGAGRIERGAQRIENETSTTNPTWTGVSPHRAERYRH
jgi:hypothetical protein